MKRAKHKLTAAERVLLDEIVSRTREMIESARRAIGNAEFSLGCVDPESGAEFMLLFGKELRQAEKVLRPLINAAEVIGTKVAAPKSVPARAA